MKKILLLFFIISALLPLAAKTSQGSNDSALKTKVTQWMSNASGIRFLENKGQMMDMQRKPVPNVLYQASGGGMSQRDPFGDVYITTSGVSYVFVDLKRYKKKNSSIIHFPNGSLPGKEHNDSVTEIYCRADMQLVDADIRKENIIKEGESTDRSDYYYGGICPNGVLGVHSYEKVTIKNIYPGIDWVLHSGKNGLKYDFIVHPGADPSLIKLKYKWTDRPELQPDGSIKISTLMGNITEGIPISYTGNEQVQTMYSIENNEIHFKLNDYNTTETLVIDPALVWATYYAGTGNNVVEDMAAMQEDGKNVWITGTTNMTQFPAYNPGHGAYFDDTATAPNGDIFILQFDVNGILKWATYYGGTDGNYGNSIYSDDTNVWVTGNTDSRDFPLLNPGHGAYFQATPGGQNDFILKFSTAGVRKWATYYGGTNVNADIDMGMSIQSDGKNVWLTGETNSADFPTLNPGGGAYFQGALAGTYNSFIAQFDTSGAWKWGTYYGGNDISGHPDGSYSIFSDGKNVWVTGTTGSTNFPTYNPGGGAYYQATLASLSGNAFILQFNTAGVRKWATYFGGSIIFGGDEGHCIYSDGISVWITGYTSSTNFPLLNPGGGAYFQGTLPSKYGSIFISQFDTSGVYKWGTYYGGSGNSNQEYGDVGLSIQSDKTNVWVGGSTSSTDFPTYSSGCGYYDDTLGRTPTIYPSQDAFILQFSPTGVRRWATYYGTDIEDDGSGIWSDGSNLFVAGDAEYNGYPSINPGGGAYYWDSTINVDNENVFVGKFLLPGKLAVSSGASVCRGQSTTLSASGATYYNWSPPTGLSATNIANPTATPTVTTTYTLTAKDTGACGGTFIDSVKVIVDTLGKLIVSKDTSVCNGNSVTLYAHGGTSYNWSTGATTSSISISDFSTSKTYTVSISNGACVKDTGMAVTVLPLPNLIVAGVYGKCAGESDTVFARGGTTYLWSNGYTGSAYAAIINSVTTLTITAYNSSGCSHDTTITITPDIPILSACCNTIITAGNDTTLVAKGNTTNPYVWSPQVTCLNPPLCDSVKVSPAVTTTYSVTITDSAGCQVERTIIIDVKLPCDDFVVPNVFTPGYPGLLGVDNIFYIETTNLNTWSIIIYDRWGKEMYNSINPNQYWDGNTESGSKAPDGVYYYIINATCQGNTYKKDGFLQLIR